MILIDAASLALQGAGQGYGEFSELITSLQLVLYSLTTIGFLVGCAVKAAAGPDEEKHTLAHKMIGTCITAAIFIYLAQGLYDLMFGWTGG